MQANGGLRSLSCILRGDKWTEMWEQASILLPWKSGGRNLMLLKGMKMLYEGETIRESEEHIKKMLTSHSLTWLIQWLTSFYNDEIHAPIFFSSHPSPLQSLILYSLRLLYSCLGSAWEKKLCLVFITATRFPPYKAFNSYLSSHAHLGAWIEYDSEGRLES